MTTTEPKPPSAEALEVAKWLDAAVVPQSSTRMSMPRDVVVMLCTAYLEGRELTASAPANAPAAVPEWYASSVVQDANGQTYIATVGRCEVNDAVEGALHYEETIFEVLGHTKEDCQANLDVLMNALNAPAATGDAVRALVEKWRREMASDTERHCADELEAALSADKASGEAGR